MPSPHDPVLSSIAATAEHLAREVASMADALDGDTSGGAAPVLYEAERGLLSAVRAIERARPLLAEAESDVGF